MEDRLAKIDLTGLLFERLPAGVAVLDTSLRVYRFNRSWADAVALYSPVLTGEVTPGRNLFDLLPGIKPALAPLFERALAGETVERQALPLESGGVVSYWDLALSPIYENGEIAGVLEIASEVTGQVNVTGTRGLASLLDLAQDAAATLELESLLYKLLDLLKRFVDYDGATFLQLEGDDLVVLAHRGPIDPAKLQTIRFSYAEAASRETIRRHQTIIIPDVQADTPLARAYRQSGGRQMADLFGYVRSWLAVPLVVKDRVIGLLSLDHGRPGAYGLQHARLALAFANQVAIFIENARLFASLEQRTRELEALYRADEELYRNLELDDVLAALVSVTAEILAADKCSVMVWDEAHRLLRVRAHRGFHPETVAQMSFRPGEGLVGTVVEEGQLVVVEDAQGDPCVAHRITDAEGIRSFMHVPLRISDRIFGVFNVSYCQRRAFGEEARRLFVALAQRAALVIENARLYEHAQAAAAAEERNRLARELHDAVTQTLFSASLIADVLPRIWERDRTQGEARLKELRELTRGALAEMRALLLELRPATLTEVSLGELLRQLADALIGRSRLPIALDVQDDPELPPAVQVALYRIAQESLNNIVKHSGATRATITLAMVSEGLMLRIEDDGRGFSADAIGHDSLGLSIMRERAEGIGATLQIESQQGRGTIVTVCWAAESVDGERELLAPLAVDG